MSDTDNTPVVDDSPVDPSDAAGVPADDEITTAIAALDQIEPAVTGEDAVDAVDTARETPVEDDVEETPEAIAGEAMPDAVLAEAVGVGLTWIPFALYLGAWVVLVGATAYLLWGATPDEPARWHPAYTPLVWTGVGLTALGPILSLAVWLIARSRRPKVARQGLFASAMTRGALATFFGVLLWIAALYALELYTTTGGL